MNVTISQIEANLIAEKIGIKSKQLALSQSHKRDEFIGIPCVFLKDGSCSIYDMRPFVCRKHIWFDTTAYWCDPERSLDVTMPMIGFSGAEGAFFDVTKKTWVEYMRILETSLVDVDIRESTIIQYLNSFQLTFACIYRPVRLHPLQRTAHCLCLQSA